MAQPIPIYRRANGAEEAFYAPRFEIWQDGQRLPREVMHDVTQVTYKDAANAVDSFQLAVNNWDAGTRKPKYVGLPGELTTGKVQNAEVFRVGRELEVHLGYGADLVPMVVGNIKSVESDFPGSGAPSLTVQGLSVLDDFRKKQHTWSWEKKRDSDIAKELGQQPSSKDRPGLDFKVCVDSQAAASEAEEPYVLMYNQFDILFLLDRARRHGYSVYLKVDPTTKERCLYFGPPEAERDVTYELTWGGSLMQFRPVLVTSGQVLSATVRGWNRRTRDKIVKTARWQDVDINADLRKLPLGIDEREEVVMDRPVHTTEQATALARDLLSEQLKKMVTASGSTVGLPNLRTGRKVHIQKLGELFSGEYVLSQTTHTMGESGYRTTFSAYRIGAVGEAQQ